MDKEKKKATGQKRNLSLTFFSSSFGSCFFCCIFPSLPIHAAEMFILNMYNTSPFKPNVN